MILNKEIILQNEIKTNIVNIIRVIDEAEYKKVYCVIEFNGIEKFITLWEGVEYDAIGQWTDDDVKNRLNEIF